VERAFLLQKLELGAYRSLCGSNRSDVSFWPNETRTSKESDPFRISRKIHTKLVMYLADGAYFCEWKRE